MNNEKRYLEILGKTIICNTVASELQERMTDENFHLVNSGEITGFLFDEDDETIYGIKADVNDNFIKILKITVKEKIYLN